MPVPSSEFVFPNDQPVVALDAGGAFKVRGAN